MVIALAVDHLACLVNVRLCVDSKALLDKEQIGEWEKNVGNKARCKESAFLKFDAKKEEDHP